MEGRPATAEEQAVLARWSSWGALPQVFDTAHPEWADRREQLRAELDDAAWDQASRTTLNAHYTDPAYVAEVWGALGRLGFKGGRVLEPGSGAGTFIGMAPAGAAMTGVEWDATTAAISQALYPHAEIRAESFADTALPDRHFDATVGNVPFSSVALHDPAHNAGGHAMHNHFILKSLALTRPGGMVAVLTSRFTMDAVNPAARREMNRMADLVGAVRLPTGAHRRAAGTEAVTDLLVFRRREPGTPPRDLEWETVSARRVDGETVKVNTYFDIHPDHVLGAFHMGHGMHGAQTLEVESGDLEATPARLRQALEDITERAVARGDVFAPADPALEAERAAWRPAEPGMFEGTIEWDEPAAGFTAVVGGQHAILPVPKAHTAELRALLGLRDQAKAIVQNESASAEDTPQLAAARSTLRSAYETYTASWGPLNRYTLRRTGRMDKETGEEKYAHITPTATRIMRDDPYGPLVMALERFDEETQTAAPASILVQRVNAPRHRPLGADTPEEALAISMDEAGRPDLARIASLLGVGEEEARAGLAGLVYEDPAGAGLVPAAEYLSGNVRAKLEQAEQAALDDATRWQPNVQALRQALPADVPMHEISVRMCAAWIGAADHQQFLRQLLDDPTMQVRNPTGGMWDVKGRRGTLKASNQWGTQRRSAIELAAAILEQRPIKVDDEYEDYEGRTKRVPNPVETEAAQQKAQEIQDRFAEWVWADSSRAQRLHAQYNRQFNSIVLRDYTKAGEALSLPGLSVGIALRPHQRTAVARMVAEPAVGLFHQVGAGKTLEMAVGATELRRLGMVRKPAVVVPNHMLEQFSREWLQAYPAARILAASGDDLGDEAKRRRFVARAAANDWDAVVFTQSAFKKLGMQPASIRQYMDTELAAMRADLEKAKADTEDRISVKQLEKALLTAEENLKKRLDTPADPGVTFEATGIDYLVVDEAHMYKNLDTVSKNRGLARPGSQLARDMHLKITWLRGRYGNRVATMATATPLANSVTEAHVMQRYLRPDLLEAAGLSSFDAWAATFGQSVTSMEVSTTGGFRQKTRFAKFQNVPEMLRMWHVFADVKTAQDLNLPVPAIAARPGDGQRVPEVVVVPASPELEQFMEDLGRRAEDVASGRVEPEEDNMLSISNDGRIAGLDLRMVSPFNPAEPSGPTKLGVAADRIAAIWADTRENVYTDDTGQPSPVRGGLQLVFLDLGTPKADRWDAYHELKALLADRGVPAEGIRFMQEANNDKDKARMFAAARSGHVSVLMGSTARMGVGTNVQDRLTALHHIDCPWRPADLEQRDGRGIRQGNQNPEVAVIRYVTEGSFDAYMWQTVQRKAGFIGQVMRGRLDVREIEDLGDDQLSAAEVKALAAGNPILLEQANAEADWQKLHRQETAYHRGQAVLAATRTELSARIDRRQSDLEQLREAATCTFDVSGESFRMSVRGSRADTRADAAAAIASWARSQGLAWARIPDPVPLAEIAGHTVAASVETASTPQGIRRMLRLQLEGVPGSSTLHTPEEAENAGLGLIRTLENKTTAIPRSIAGAEQDIQKARAGVAEADARLGGAFPHADALAAAQTRLDRVTAQLEEQRRQQEDAERQKAQAAPEPAAPGPQATAGLPIRNVVLTVIGRDGNPVPPDSPRPASPDLPRRRYVVRKPADPNTGPVIGGPSGPSRDLDR